MTILGTPFALAGTGLAAYGILDASASNANLLESKAQYMQLQAADMINQGRAAALDAVQAGKSVVGAQQASYAGQGVEVGSGSALAVQQDTMAQSKKAADLASLQAARQAWGLSTSASFANQEASNTRRTGRIQAAAELLNGTANAMPF